MKETIISAEAVTEYLTISRLHEWRYLTRLRLNCDSILCNEADDIKSYERLVSVNQSQREFVTALILSHIP